jgi:hypothetical protein
MLEPLSEFLVDVFGPTIGHGIMLGAGIAIGVLLVLFVLWLIIAVFRGWWWRLVPHVFFRKRQRWERVNVHPACLSRLNVLYVYVERP